ncbi:hypothetical protein QN277_000351 [Acacia crassicarpa]|uniref:PUM-HD domain-containing protein n=1 Tax=Acacia crassicarpa TaxID=499986 RepID=A0AAE1TH22_9FABA|nr:hypothetical protein QN277_000351 [Acacia crassicarpa]
MAAKKQQVDKTKKRKRIPGSNNEADKPSPSKVPKLAASKRPFPPKNKASGKPSKFIKKGPNVTDDKEKKAPLTARERRLHSKELAEARKKKRKRHYTLEQDLARLWEKMRRRDIAKEDKAKLVTEALQKMKGKITEIAGSHVSSRVLQTCVKHCSQAERDAVFEELCPHFITLSYNAYAVHLVKKMLDHASKKQLAGFISSLHGHVASLLRHMVGSVVVEHAYELATAAQKQELLLELCSTELRLFKNLVSVKEGRLVDVISKLGLQKGSVLRHMTSVIQPILEKGIVDHSITHRLLTEYISIADKSSVRDIMEQLSSPLLVRMIGTRDGAKLGILCVKHGSAKERKKIIKGMKGHMDKIAYHKNGCLVLVCIISVVDDTQLITKAIISELQRILKELILDKTGRCVLLQLLHPNCSRYFSPDDLASLNSYIPSLVEDRSEASTQDETSKVEEPCEKEREEDMEVTAEEAGKDKTSKVEEHSDKEAEEDMGVTADEANKDKTSKVDEQSDKEAGEDMEDEANKDKTSGEDSHLIESGKKDPIVRRQELLIESGLAESLIDICIENAGELIQSNFGKDVLYEVATGGCDGILHPALDDKINLLHKAIASLAATPKSEEEEHVLENFHSSRTIRKLVLDCPNFASTLWKKALKGKSEIWAHGHSCKVISAFVESSDAKIKELARNELQPLVDRGILRSQPKPLI